MLNDVAALSVLMGVLAIGIVTLQGECSGAMPCR
jgi:hypothetical protein